MYQIKWRMVGLIVWAILLVACGSENGNEVVTEPVVGEAAASTDTPLPPTTVPTSTSIPEPTETPISVPSDTPLPTDTPTPEPIPTIDIANLPSGQWVELAPMLSVASVSEMPVVHLDGKLYTISGLTSGANLPGITNALVYDIASNSWDSIASLPQERHHGMAAAYAGKIYFFGGSQSFSLSAESEAWVYDPTTDTWSSLANLPSPRSAGTALVVADFIYIVGGVGEPLQPIEVVRYDPATDSYELLAPVQEKREHIAAVVWNNQIYVLGGRWAVELNSVEIYDIATDTWSYGTPMQELRAGHGAALLNDKFYVFGGELWLSEAGRTLTTAEVYDPATDSWVYLPELPIPLHGVPAIAVADVIYVVGGSTIAATSQNSGTLYAYRP